MCGIKSKEYIRLNVKDRDKELYDIKLGAIEDDRDSYKLNSNNLVNKLQKMVQNVNEREKLLNSCIDKFNNLLQNEGKKEKLLSKLSEFKFDKNNQLRDNLMDNNKNNNENKFDELKNKIIDFFQKSKTIKNILIIPNSENDFIITFKLEGVKKNNKENIIEDDQNNNIDNNNNNKSFDSSFDSNKQNTNSNEQNIDSNKKVNNSIYDSDHSICYSDYSYEDEQQQNNNIDNNNDDSFFLPLSFKTNVNNGNKIKDKDIEIDICEDILFKTKKELCNKFKDRINRFYINGRY